MTLHSYLLFVFSSIVLAVALGSGMAYMLGRCIAQGRRTGVLAALGFNASSCFYRSTAVLGLSAVLAASPIAFNVIRRLGAAYLIYLGIDAIRSKGTLAINGDRNGKRMVTFSI